MAIAACRRSGDLALGDGHYGAALAFAEEVDPDEMAPVAVADLGRLLADLRSQRVRGGPAGGEGLPEWLVGGPDSVEGVAFQICEAGRKITGRPCAWWIVWATSSAARLVAA